MKKSLKIIGVCLIIILNAVGFCSCSLTKDRTFVSDDYFVCYKRGNGSNGYKVAILELTEIGLQQEALIIPKHISGMEVYLLGGSLPGIGFPKPIYFKSNNLRKLYIPYNPNLLLVDTYMQVPNATAVVLMDEQDFVSDAYIPDCFKKQVFLFSVYDIEQYKNNDYSTEIICANCFFYKNDEIVWIDYIADGEVYALPADLQIDWYLEPECINLWNGEYVIPDGQEHLNLYSK